jgi:DNA-binding NarL/FixJ family response regulator
MQEGSTAPKRASAAETKWAGKAAPARAERRTDVQGIAAAAPVVAEASARGRKIRVLLADDHTMMREGLALLLRQEPDIEMVGEAFDGEGAVELAGRLRPDVVVMDVTMPRLNGIEATRRIVAELAGVSVIALSMHEEADMAAAMRAAGASDYVTKDSPPDVLVAAIRACAAGRGKAHIDTAPKA